MGILKKLFAFSLGFLLLQRFCLSQTDGFTMLRIQSNMPNDPTWESHSNINLSQPFYYIGCGAQTFAFASDDLVIKFYRHHRAGHPLALFAPLFPRLQQTIAKRQAKRQKDFASFRLAYDHLRDETGLVCIHLGKTNQLNQKITIYDKLGIAHEIDLDQMEFIIQKRATPFYTTLEKWIDSGQWEKAERGIRELVALLRNRCEKGIFDKDPDLRTNFGFLDDHPIQIDIGRFKEGPDDMIRVTDTLKKWLEVKAPHLIEELQ